MCRGEKGCLFPEDLEEVQCVEYKNAKAGPAGADAGQGEEGIDAQDTKGNQRMTCSLLHQDKVGIWCRLADDGALVQSKVEKDESGYTGDGARDIDALPDTGAFRLWRYRGWSCRYHEEPQGSQHGACKAKDPIRPRPPESMSKQAGENGTKRKAARSSGSEQAENHILTKLRVIAATENGYCVGE